MNESKMLLLICDAVIELMTLFLIKSLNCGFNDLTKGVSSN